MPDNSERALWETIIIDGWREIDVSTSMSKWRFRVRDIRANEKFHFVTRDDLIDYLNDYFDNPQNDSVDEV